ncbi:MAG: pilus assembly protein PilP [Betaproteobacteria bacterium]|nr:pilus assembly protein PilP [Betaproteobacteria bacterium]
MIRNVYLIALMMTPLTMLTACSQNDFSDLEAFVQSAGEGLQGHIDPLPEIKQHQYFTYQAFDIPSPFVPRKNDQVQTVGSGIQPDLMRRKEILESYPLESLLMVGTLQQRDKIFAVIKSPDGTLYRVQVGNYLGQNFGKINHISESEVKLSEIVQDGVNEWTEKTSALMLKN